MSITREDYRRLEGFVADRQLAAPYPNDEPLGRYLLVNFTFLGIGVAAWSGVVAALIWILF
jgi:hypothetical protein